jgi:hypothetical protein
LAASNSAISNQANRFVGRLDIGPFAGTLEEYGKLRAFGKTGR